MSSLNGHYGKWSRDLITDKSTWKARCYYTKHNQCLNKNKKCGCPCHITSRRDCKA